MNTDGNHEDQMERELVFLWSQTLIWKKSHRSCCVMGRKGRTYSRNRTMVGFCFEGVSSLRVQLCASMHLQVKLRVHVGYLYHLFTFSCLYLVAVSHLSPPLFWPTSCSLWLSPMPHGLLTHHSTSSIKLKLKISIFMSSKKQLNAYV